MKVLVFGDSLVQGLELNVPHTLACHTGATTDTLLQEFPNLTYYLESDCYTHVVLIAGTNDTNPYRAVGNLLQLIEQVYARGAEPVAVTLMDDNFNQEYTNRLSAKTQLCTFLLENIDTDYLADDGLHLNIKGQAAFSVALNLLIHKHKPAPHKL